MPIFPTWRDSTGSATVFFTLPIANRSAARSWRYSPAERYGEARFGFVPASGLLGSDYPLVKLREFALGGDNGNDPPDIHDNPQSVLVARKDYEISLWPLSQAEFVFLGTLKIEQTLGNAVERAIECDESFNLNDTLSRCFHSGVLQDWHLPEDQ